MVKNIRWTKTKIQQKCWKLSLLPKFWAPWNCGVPAELLHCSLPSDIGIISCIDVFFPTLTGIIIFLSTLAKCISLWHQKLSKNSSERQAKTTSEISSTTDTSELLQCSLSKTVDTNDLDKINCFRFWPGVARQWKKKCWVVQREMSMCYVPEMSTN